MLKAVLTILFCTVAAAGVAAQEKFLCLGSKATGFRLEGKTWVPTVFKVDEDKFLVQPIPREELFGRTYDYEVRKLGQSQRMMTCERGEFNKKPSSRIICGGLGHGMIFDTNSLRYQELYGFGYLEGEDKPGNTPSFTIGTCTRIN